MARGGADEFVTDFGEDLSVLTRDPPRLEGKVLVADRHGLPGVPRPPGTPAARYVAPGLAA